MAPPKDDIEMPPISHSAETMAKLPGEWLRHGGGGLTAIRIS